MAGTRDGGDGTIMGAGPVGTGCRAAAILRPKLREGKSVLSGVHLVQLAIVPQLSRRCSVVRQASACTVSVGL